MDLILLAGGILAIFGITFVYSNLGMGGGILYVPVLFWLTGYSEDMIVPISLTFVLANCTTALANHQKVKLVDWKLGLILTSGAIIGTLIGTWFNLKTGREIFLLIFIGVVLAAVIKLLIDWLEKREELDMDDDSKLTRSRLAAASTGSIAGGFMCGCLGLGGGVVNVPILMYILGRGTRKAIGTSFLIMALAAIIGIGTYFAEGVSIDMFYVFTLAPVVLIASYIGSRWGLKSLKGRSVRLLFILVLLVALIKITFDLLILT
jgi:uncharacterized membrane protein YfcA